MKKAIMAIAALAATMAATVAHADTWTDPETGITWIYTVSNGKASLGGGILSGTVDLSTSGGFDLSAWSTSITGILVMPSTINEYSVTSIGSYAFSGYSGLTSVTIPDSVTSIGKSAFSGCSGLTSVTIPDSVTSIGWSAFSGCSGLTSVTIPDSVTSIDSYAFSGCSSLTSFIVGAGNPSYMSVNGLLLSKDGKTLIAGVNGDVTIPGGVTNIASFAFYGCSGLTSVTIPESVKNIGIASFLGCYNLENISVDTANSAYKSENRLLLTKNGKKVIQGVNGDVVIPDGVVCIDSLAFSDGSNIPYPYPIATTSTGGSLPGGTGDSTLTGGSGTTWGACIPTTTPSSDILSVDNSEIVTEIPEVLRYSSSDLKIISGSGLRSVTMPDSLKLIGCYAFSGCTNLVSAKIPEGVSGVYDGAFRGCSRLRSVAIPGNVLTWIVNEYPYYYYDYGSSGSTGLPSASGTMSGGTTTTGGYSPWACLTSVFGDSLWAVEDLVILGGLAQLPEGVFYNCNSLKSISIPHCVCVNGLRTYFSEAACQSITNITINAGAGRLEDSAFAECPNLTSVSIPNTVTRFGDNVFKDCNVLRKIVFDGDAPDIGENVFLGTPKSLVITVNEGSIGWVGDFSDDLPSSWGGRRIVNSSNPIEPEVVPSGPSSSVQVSLTVTNVVVHYVLNSVVPEIAVPVCNDTGFVAVVAEVKGSTVAIPESWSANYPSFTEKFGDNFAEALSRPSGKRDSQGNPLMVWQDYVAGTDPTDEEDVFQASIVMVDGAPQISYTPELSDEEKSKRRYVTYGKERLQDEDWTVVDGDAGKYNFFKVTVEMK